MPLPASNVSWPPAELAQITPAFDEWAAWYEGTPEGLADVYSSKGGAAAKVRTRPSQYRGGVVGAVSRFFWGNPSHMGQNTRSASLHIPLAADIALASADLLYADPPALTVESIKRLKRTQDRLNEYMADDMVNVLASGAEIGAALGGRFHRVTWDLDLDNSKPFLSTVHADNAVPEFRFGRLTGVTFWTVVARNGNQVLRHLERHELDRDGRGLVLHALYEGTDTNLGQQVPLTENTATEALANKVGADGALIEGRTPGLCVAYAPNRGPQRRWRTHPLGQNLGRSDFDGVEGLFDQLDETWSSWMRDLRLGRARLLVAQQMLDANGIGQGASFDMDREVFTPLAGVLANREDNGLPIDQVQFDIRVDEHERTAKALVDQIVRTCGYSAGTFGEAHAGDADVTATEVSARKERSLLTRDRKLRHERPMLAALVGKMLSVDAEVFGAKGIDPTAPVVVEFPEAVQESAANLAQTSTLLKSAGAASTETLVRMNHPDWEDDEVTAEVARIREETATAPAIDPTTLRARPDGTDVDEKAPAGAVPAAE